MADSFKILTFILFLNLFAELPRAVVLNLPNVIIGPHVVTPHTATSELIFVTVTNHNVNIFGDRFAKSCDPQTEHHRPRLTISSASALPLSYITVSPII